MLDEGVPIQVTGEADVRVALRYGNHRSIAPYHRNITSKIYDDVQRGRAFIFPKSVAHLIPGLRLAPLGAVVSPSKTRIIHDLSFSLQQSASSVNADTDFESAPPVKLGHVLRQFIGRILFLRRRWPKARIVLSKMDVAEAFRQVAVSWERNTVFGYSFLDWVVIDRRLLFGWTNSPGYFCLCSDALNHAHTHTSFADAVVSDQGRRATQHVQVQPPRADDVQTSLPAGCYTPPGSGGGRDDEFYSAYYVDDGLLCEVQHYVDGRRCLRSSGTLASDHYRLFGGRRANEPPILSARKVSSWDTQLEVLGWDIDTVAMTISVPPARLAQLWDLLEQWPATRKFAPEKSVRSLIGKLLHICEVVRPGKFFVRRMLNQLGLRKIQAGREKFGAPSDPRNGRSTLIKLRPEFHADVAFWRLMVDGSLKRGESTLTAPLYSTYRQPHHRTLLSDASGDAMGGFCSETGAWWRFDFNPEVRARFRTTKIHQRDELSINLLELLAMTVTAWAFIRAGNRPRYPRDCILMRGDNSSACCWVSKCRGGKEQRSGALMRVLGCLEMGSGWCFRAKHIKGVRNTLADGISRWEPRESIPTELHRMRPDVSWHEQVLDAEGLALCTETLAASTSAGQLRTRLDGLMRQASVLGAFFVPP